MGDKQNYIVIVNNKNNKENTKYIYATMHMQIYESHIYTHILTKYRARKSFVTRSINSFYNRVIFILQERKVLQHILYFTFLLTDSENY